MLGFADPFLIPLQGFMGNRAGKRIQHLLVGMAVILILICGAALGAAYTASYWLEKGDAFFEEDSYELALSSYVQAIELDPENFAAWSGKGQSLFQMGMFEEANGAFDMALEINLASSQAWKDKGKVLFELGRYSEAYEAQRKALEIDPGNAEAWYEQGRALDQMGQRYASIEAYGKALELDPGNGDAWYRRGDALRLLYRYNESVQDLDRALKIDPFNADAWQDKGLALENLGEYNRSEQALARSLEIDFMDAEAWTTKGDALSGLGLNDESDYAYNEAVAIYDKITDSDSENADAWRMKGEVLLKLGKYEASLNAFERVFDVYDLHPNQIDEDVLYNKQKVYYLLYIYIDSYGERNYNEYRSQITFNDSTYNSSELSLEWKASCENALDIYNEKLSVDQNNADAWLKKAEIFSYLNQYGSSYPITMAIGAYEEALRIYDKELKKYPKNAGIWLDKGDVLKQLGRHDESEDAYGEALNTYNDLLEKDPRNLVASYGSGNVLFKLDRYHESNKVYTQALKLRKQAVFRQIEGKDSVEILGGSNTSAYWIQVGDSHFIKGNYELALKCYEKAIVIDPQSAPAWNQKGMVLFILRDGEEAISCYDEAIKINPLYADAWRRKGVALDYLGKDYEGLKSYERANEIDPSIVIPSWLEDARYSETTTSYSSGIDSNTSAYWVQAGDGQYSKGNNELALKCYERAIEIDPQSAPAWNVRGRVLHSLGKERESVDSYDQAIKINPTYADAWRNRGAALDSLGRDDEALESYKRANEIDPSIEIPYRSQLESQKPTAESDSTEKEMNGKDVSTLIIFAAVYLIIILIYINVLKIKEFPKKYIILNWIHRHFILKNIYIPLRTLKFLEFLLLLAILCMPLPFLDGEGILVSIFVSFLLALIALGILLAGTIITIIFWILFSPPLTPCGYRAIWAEFEQQRKRRNLFNSLSYGAIIYFSISGIIAADLTIANNIDKWIQSILFSWILVAGLLTILLSAMGIMLCMNLDRQTAKSVFISQFGLVAVNGFCLSGLLYYLAKSYPNLLLTESYPQLYKWTSDFNILFILMLVLFYIIFISIPYLHGSRRAEKQRERLYAARQSLLERLAGILDAPTPGLYMKKLEDFLQDLNNEREAFIRDDWMVEMGLSWDQRKYPLLEIKSWRDFKLDVMRQAYEMSRHLDPRFNHVDFLSDLQSQVKECMEQLNLASQKVDDSELIAIAYGYAKIYHARIEEIEEAIEIERKTSPRWTVAIATIITLLLTPILDKLGKLISEIVLQLK